MRDFRFSPSCLLLSIEGKCYEVNIGDPVLEGDMVRFATELATQDVTSILADPEKLAGWYQKVSDDIHRFVVMLLGQKAHDEIYADRALSVIEDLQLFNYLNEAINDNTALTKINESLANYAPRASD